MRIGIDCRTILNPGFGEGAGIGHYTFYLVKNLLALDNENTYVLFFDGLMSDDGLDRFLGEARARVEVRYFQFHRFKKFLPYVYSQLLTAQKFNAAKLDLCHFPATSVPEAYRGKRVVTVHDLAIYDFPEWFPGGQDFAINMVVPRSIETADQVIAVSEHTKKDLLRLFRVAGQKVSVIYEGVDVAHEESAVSEKSIRELFQIYTPYVLFVGTLEPRKNLSALLRVWRQIDTDHTLVLAGAKGWRTDEIFEELELCKRQREGSARYLGYVSYEQKISLMKHASAFVFPSLYEGFGLPVLEAMALGTPVITSNLSSLPEIADGAAVLINPYDEEELKNALRDMLTNEKLRVKYGLLGKQRATIFDWRTTVAKTLEVYKQVGKG